MIFSFRCYSPHRTYPPTFNFVETKIFTFISICEVFNFELISLMFLLQPVPNWLEVEARRNPEGHHGTGGGQRFGGRDIRTSGPGFNHNNTTGPGFVAPGQPVERDDGWD